MTDLSVKIAGIQFKNPVIAASGTFGYGSEYSELIDISRLGGICTKGLTLNPKAGNEGIRLWETASGLLNSIGLENPGIRAFIEKELPIMRKLGPVVIANLSGADQEEYVKGAELLNASDIDMIELNISCPNVKAGGMAFGLESDTAGELTANVRRVCTNKPLMVKLSPNAPSVQAVALACVKSGADALSLVNTFKAMAIDIVNRKPVFNNISAGLSGPAIKPLALRMVWELCEALKVPVIGLGGIKNADDAIEFFMAGARAVQIGTATFAQPNTMIEIIEGLEKYLSLNELQRIEQIAINREIYRPTS
jgi:dihydroorotate dehydrogenase (NAD+) catalytic subunit